MIILNWVGHRRCKYLRKYLVVRICWTCKWWLLYTFKNQLKKCLSYCDIWWKIVLKTIRNKRSSLTQYLKRPKLYVNKWIKTSYTYIILLTESKKATMISCYFILFIFTRLPFLQYRHSCFLFESINSLRFDLFPYIQYNTV